MIRAEGLTKYYGRFAAINELDFEVGEGEIVGFLGPNGAGKTTTMRILVGYMPPTSGSAKVGGYDVVDDSMEVRKRVGYLPETVPLYTDMTVSGYLSRMAKLHHAAADGRGQDVLAVVGLLERANSLIGSLSKGMRQRVGLAQALIHNPDVLILDEPTIGLDPRQKVEALALIKELGQDHTVLLSTHILSEAQAVCDRLLIINKGRIVAEDTPAGLARRLQGGDRFVVQVEQAGANALDVLGGVPGVAGVEATEDGYILTSQEDADARAAVAATVVGQGWGLLELRPLDLSLEDIFLELTTDEEELLPETATGPVEPEKPIEPEPEPEDVETTGDEQ